jgi:Tfp pilus assembly protein PilF
MMNCKCILAALGVVFASNTNCLEVIKCMPGDATRAGRIMTERALEFLRQEDYSHADEQMREFCHAAAVVLTSVEEVELINAQTAREWNRYPPIYSSAIPIYSSCFLEE